MTIRIAAPVAVLLLTLFSSSLAAGEIDGTVRDTAGAPVVGAAVRITTLAIETVTDDHGHFHFDDVPPGTHTVIVDGTAGPVSRRITVGDGTARVAIALGVTKEERIVVTASPLAGRSPLEMARAVQVLGGDALARRAGATLGETVAGEPGVTATGFGQGASRPIIRGLGDDRVRVLRSGIGTLDVSSVSDDHSVALEPLLLDQVEVLRGPATLLYGSGAIGGVVNAVDSRIPERRQAHGFEGRAEVRTASGNDERSAVVRLDGGAGDHAAWHADAYRRSLGEYTIAGGDHLHNSEARNAGGAFGASWITDRGYAGASVSVLDNAYGVPGHAHGDEDDDEDDHDHDHDVRIAQRQLRLDLAGARSEPLPGFEVMRWRFGIADYEHQELEGHEVGTVFRNDGWEGRIEATHRPARGWHGAVGVQLARRDFEAIGDEAFTPPVVTSESGVFWVGEREFARVRLEAGARFDHVRHDPDMDPNRTFTLPSVSLGAAVPLGGPVELVMNGGAYARAPAAEALYSFGPHLASLTFEVGDPALGRERSRAFEAIVRDGSGDLRWSLTGYRNAFDGFVHQSRTGAVDAESGLDVVEYRQADAVFHGFEAEVEAQLGERVTVGAFADRVRASFADGTPVSRIPPARHGVELAYGRAAWTARLEWTRVAAQRRVGPHETVTPGHDLVAAGLDYRGYAGANEWFVFLRGTNLLDEDARRHVSFLKDEAPLPGRSWQLGFRVEF